MDFGIMHMHLAYYRHRCWVVHVYHLLLALIILLAFALTFLALASPILALAVLCSSEIFHAAIDKRTDNSQIFSEGFELVLFLILHENGSLAGRDWLCPVRLL